MVVIHFKRSRISKVHVQCFPMSLFRLYKLNTFCMDLDEGMLPLDQEIYTRLWSNFWDTIVKRGFRIYPFRFSVLFSSVIYIQFLNGKVGCYRTCANDSMQEINVELPLVPLAPSFASVCGQVIHCSFRVKKI